SAGVPSQALTQSGSSRCVHHPSLNAIFRLSRIIWMAQIANYGLTKPVAALCLDAPRTKQINELANDKGTGRLFP
ncbi:MAG TPA: hypothetical protein VJ728_06625, partial [Candidatus Binataceae bacterium]|nr:hypothetical protein [Candidatus Binataceae bacterium]